MYKLIFSKRAIYEFNQLEKLIKSRIWNKLQLCKENPFKYFEKLRGINSFKLRVANYRVVADISKGKLIILVLKVGHRKKVYYK